MFVCQENLWVERLRLLYCGYGFGVWLGSGFKVCFFAGIGKNTNNEKKI